MDEPTSTSIVIAPSMSAMTMPLSSTRGPLRPSGAGRPISTTRLQVGMPGGDGRTSLTPSALSFTLRSGTLLTSLASRPSAAWPSGETSTRSRPPRPSGGMNDSSSARPVSGSACTSRYAVERKPDSCATRGVPFLSSACTRATCRPSSSPA